LNVCKLLLNLQHRIANVVNFAVKNAKNE
jgi:hypothetical protein